jgi:hypothetical protein
MFENSGSPRPSSGQLPLKMKNTALSGIRLRKPREILENWNKDFEK